MKKLIIGLFACGAFMLSAQAQETRKGKDKMHSQHHRKMHDTKALNLSDDQKSQMKAHREETKKQLQELEKNDGITVKEYRSRKQAIHQQQKEKWNSILTDEQKSQVAAARAEKKSGHRMNRGERMEQMKSRLNLTDEQVASLKASRETNRAQLKSIRENEKLSDTEKKARFKEIKEQYNAEFKKTLTPDQLQQMETFKKSKKKDPIK